MVWELDYSDKEFSIQARIAKKLPPPEWVDDEPFVYPGDEFFLTAFYELSSCRSIGDRIGPIPWRDIIHYADRKGLDPEVSDAFVYILREMDSAYIKWWGKQEQKIISSKGAAHGGIQGQRQNRPIRGKKWRPRS